MTNDQSAIPSLAQPYLEGLNEHLLRYQHCTACARAQTFAHDACQFCGATSLEWHTSTGRGHVYAVTVVGRAPSDAFRSLAPYTLVVVTLEEGARLMGHATPRPKNRRRGDCDFFCAPGANSCTFPADWLIESEFNV
jgi:uncharacterized OB-fold protein